MTDEIKSLGQLADALKESGLVSETPFPLEQQPDGSFKGRISIAPGFLEMLREEGLRRAMAGTSQGGPEKRDRGFGGDNAPAP